MPDVAYSLGGVRNETQNEADRTRARMAQMMFEREMRDRAEAVSRQNAQLGADLTREGWGRQDAQAERALSMQNSMWDKQAAMTREGWGREDARSDRGLQLQRDIIGAQTAESAAQREAEQERWNKMFEEQKAANAPMLERANLGLSVDRLRADILSGKASPDTLTDVQRVSLGIPVSAKEAVRKQEELDTLTAGTTRGRREMLSEQQPGFQAIGRGVAGETWFSGKDAERYKAQAAMLLDSLRQQGADDRAIESAKNRIKQEISLGASDWTFGSGGAELQRLYSLIDGL